MRHATGMACGHLPEKCLNGARICTSAPRYNREILGMDQMTKDGWPSMATVDTGVLKTIPNNRCHHRKAAQSNRRLSVVLRTTDKR